MTATEFEKLKGEVTDISKIISGLIKYLRTAL